MTEAQTKMGKMGVELDRDVRLKELTDFVDDIRKNIASNKDKIKEAQTAAQKADTAAAAGAQVDAADSAPVAAKK